MLSGKGACRFCDSNGFVHTDLLTPESEKEWLEWKKDNHQNLPEINHENHDTIAMITIDNKKYI